MAIFLEENLRVLPDHVTYPVRVTCRGGSKGRRLLGVASTKSEFRNMVASATEDLACPVAVYEHGIVLIDEYIAPDYPEDHPLLTGVVIDLPEDWGERLVS